jgi:hypothetical protein
MSSMTAVLPDRRARPAGGHPAFKDTLHSPTTPGRPDRASSGDEAHEEYAEHKGRRITKNDFRPRERGRPRPQAGGGGSRHRR